MLKPTRVRKLNDAEWAICTRVFTPGKLPFRFRIGITDGLGAGDRPFTAPTSAMGAIFGAATMSALGAGIGYVASAVNLGYFIMVGPRPYDDMSVSHKALLVHEMTHVYQSKRDTFALSVMLNSGCAQAGAAIKTGSTDAAYDYTVGADWSSYNPEQQAEIVEDWFKAGELETDPRFRYIRDDIRGNRVTKSYQSDMPRGRIA